MRKKFKSNSSRTNVMLVQQQKLDLLNEKSYMDHTCHSIQYLTKSSEAIRQKEKSKHA